MRRLDWFEVFTIGALVILGLCLVAVVAEGLHVAITGTPLVGEWIVIGSVTCN